MRLLVLGGTNYIGRQLVEHAIADGHQVTLFNRGRNTAVFPGVPRLTGDRAADGSTAGLAALAAGDWDAVFDFSGFLPRQVDATARLLAPRIAHYTFMSSIAVYPRTSQAGTTEDAETRRLANPAGSAEPEGFTAQTYGPLKAACEQAIERALPGRATSIRSGLVIGPGDPFGAFPSWAIAMAGDGLVPCAARPDQPVQTTDVRDLATFMVHAGTTPLPGIFNVMTPPITFADLLETCRLAGGGSATVRWTLEENIDKFGAEIVQPRDGSDDGVFQLSSQRALLAGFRPRPFEQTARDTIDWIRQSNPTFTTPH
jgi:2'-hydroxyisoflavone reductase